MNYHDEYPLEIKLNAIKLCHQKESIRLVALELNISEMTLYNWKAMYRKGNLIGGKLTIVVIEKSLAYRKLEHKFNVTRKALKETKLELQILRKGKEFLLRTTIEKYEFIRQNKSKYPIALMCRVFKVHQCNYCRWCLNPVSTRKENKRVVMQEIKRVFYEHKGRHGDQRIAFELQAAGFKISQELVRNYMKEAGLKVIREKRYIITTNSRHHYPVRENKLSQQFKPSRYNEVWVSDITYVRMGGYRDWLFLTVIIDLFDRKIIGWALSEGMAAQKTTLVAFKMAVSRRPIGKYPLIFHSDRGAQYACNEFTFALKRHPSIIQSMSRKGNMWDNAVAESFFSILKLELINENVYKTKKQAEASIYDYIENYYNKVRRHSALGNMTIDEFHESLKK
ncbi:IS3 family transposase [Flavobacterium amniphilum]|uniref:IS3 family transposase n=1 Tax=Flavobacterium amniphilum TaxID=1834035 RepID=UPI002029E016|nr:IS3 family transposase [Flavobacterium amniphilum]MCL9807050.1 IS3 family transposase [Flavobacterium amniphilum]